MAHTEKDLEIEGHTHPTQPLLAETQRLLDLARGHSMALRPLGYDVKNFTEIDQLKELVAKEHNRVEGKPPKAFVPTKDQEKLLARAYTWRAQMIRRADRAFHDDRYNRLKYHRAFLTYGAMDRLFEELYHLAAHARVDLKRLASAGVDDAFIAQGEDLCFELSGQPAPNRKAHEEYQKALKEHKWGPPPKEPEPLPKLPSCNDNAKNLSIMRGRLYLMLRQLSAAGQLSFCSLDAKDAQKAEAARRDFALRIQPMEDDEELFTLGRSGAKAGPAARPAARPGTAAASPASPPAEAAPAMTTDAAASAEPEDKVMPMEKVTAKPGGANPPPPTDPFKKPPPRAVGLVRPSPTHGSKREG